MSGDTISVICQDYEQAIGIGIHFFVQAFYDTNKREQPFWLRGAISRWRNQTLTIRPVPIEAKGIQIGQRYLSEDDYIDILALEKSGYRGMRLLINKKFLKNKGSDSCAHWTDFKRSLGCIANLRECSYPHGSKDYSDVLWMAAGDEKRYKDLSGIMATRFKHAASRDEREFIQASWTRVVFDQVDSLIWGCKQDKTTLK